MRGRRRIGVANGTVRVIDHLVELPGRGLVAVEVKSGDAVRSAAQVAKDKLLLSQGGCVVGRHAQAVERLAGPGPIRLHTVVVRR